MFSRPVFFRFSLPQLLAVAVLALAGRTGAQTIDVSSANYTNSTSSPATWTWSPLMLYGGGTFLSDPRADQQTGQYADDMVGNSTDNPGFLMRYGTITGTGNTSSGSAVQFVALRTRLNVYAPSSYDKNAKQRFGMDANGDGKLDLFFGIDFTQKGSPTIGFQTPGTGSNSSPSTTSIGNNFTPVFDAGDETVSSTLLTLTLGTVASALRNPDGPILGYRSL